MTNPPFLLDRIIHGNVLDVIKDIPSESVQTVITSPPYFGLRDYRVHGQLGLEKTVWEYTAKMVKVFREVRRVLREDGTLWLNLGDSYANNGSGGQGMTGGREKSILEGPMAPIGSTPTKREIPNGLKSKDLVGIPWRIAFALQADGWYLRSDIIWAKPNPMPESVRDRPTKAQEYIFLMSKSEKYFYDADIIKEKSIYRDVDENRTFKPQDRRLLYKDARSYDGKHSDKQRGHSRRHAGFNDRWDHMEKTGQCCMMRNKRSVWTVPTQPFPEAHFATFPEKLIEPYILAGAPVGGIVLDPFMGAGTVALVAARLNRRFIGIELNPDYIKIAERRIAAEVRQAKMF